MWQGMESIQVVEVVSIEVIEVMIKVVVRRLSLTSRRQKESQGQCL